VYEEWLTGLLLRKGKIKRANKLFIYSSPTSGPFPEITIIGGRTEMITPSNS
jgi:hypothetical protein